MNLTFHSSVPARNAAQVGKLGRYGLIAETFDCHKKD